MYSISCICIVLHQADPKKFSKANARNWNFEAQAPPSCFTVSCLGCAVLHGFPCAELRLF